MNTMKMDIKSFQCYTLKCLGFLNVRVKQFLKYNWVKMFLHKLKVYLLFI